MAWKDKWDGVRIPGIMRASNKRVTLGLDCDSSSADAVVDSMVTRVMLTCEMSSTGRQPLAKFNQKTQGERPENVPSTVKCATGGNAAGAGVRARLAHARTQRPPPAGPKLRQKVRGPPRRKIQAAPLLRAAQRDSRLFRAPGPPGDQADDRLRKREDAGRTPQRETRPVY